ncbi:hypothetical protein ACTMU2_00120 [Cupriavidus basilensis]
MNVLLLEAGGGDDYHWIHIPVGLPVLQTGNPRTDWLYRAVAEKEAHRRPVRSAIRAARAARRLVARSTRRTIRLYAPETARRTTIDWARPASATTTGAGTPCCRRPSWRSEDHHRGPSEFHGAGGEWRVRGAAPALGYPRALYRRGRASPAFRARRLQSCDI